MKRAFLVIASIFFTLMLYSCGSTDRKIEPAKTEVLDFDIQAATQMIEKGDKIIADIAIKNVVSRHEYNKFLSDIADSYDGYEDANWEYMFYPTMYNEGVEVASAKVTNTYYHDEFLDNSMLTIREEYLGQDSKLKGWYREYLYRKNDKDQWVFYAFGGQMNFQSDGFKSDYLVLKEEL